ncbi:MAG: ester cyclase [Chloroflexota bacterium]
MTDEQNVAVVRRFLDAVNTGNLEALGDLFAEDGINHRPTGPERGLGALRQFVKSVRRRIPDLSVTVEEMIAGGDQVGVRVTLRGTSADGQSITAPGIQMYRIAEGKIAERWYVVARSALPPAAPVTPESI